MALPQPGGSRCSSSPSFAEKKAKLDVCYPSWRVPELAGQHQGWKEGWWDSPCFWGRSVAKVSL